MPKTKENKTNLSVCFVTLGCRTNEAETRDMALEAAKMGYNVFLTLEPADIYVLNTCSITAAADAKSRQLIARVLAKNPKAKIFVCGCAAERDKEQFTKNKHVKGIYGTGDKLKILDELNALKNNMPPTKINLPVRKLIKIEDGCNQFCSYCIVPFLRNKVVSVPLKQIVEEINSSPEPEINITGINLYLFKPGLSELLKAIKNTDKRIRLGSLDPRIINDEFLIAAKQIKNFCPQFHLSVQSLTNYTLTNMNRQYDVNDVLNKIKLIRKYFKNAFVACDIIAGFPSETDDDFRTTLKNAKKAKFNYMHIFPYSRRGGTVADKLSQVDNATKTARAKQLGKLNEQNYSKFLKKCRGTKHQVLIEEVKGLYAVGHTKNYVKCYVESMFAKNLVGKVINAKLATPLFDGLSAKMLDK